MRLPEADFGFTFTCDRETTCSYMFPGVTVLVDMVMASFEIGASSRLSWYAPAVDVRCETLFPKVF